MTQVEILATGRIFTRRNGVQNTKPVIMRLLRQSKRSVHMLAYVIGFDGDLWRLLAKKLSDGQPVTIITSMDGQSAAIQSSLRRLARTYGDDFCLMDFKNPAGGLLHAKVLVIDRETAVLGSANFSRGGMAKHHEVGVLIKNVKLAWELANMVEDLRDSDMTSRIT